MKKTIYHGSTDIIIKPEYGKGSIKNEYGRGFYCTEEIELAKEWACGNDTDGYANKYEIDLNKLNTLYLNSDEYSILNWLAILTRFRTYWQSSSIAEEAKQYLQDNFYIDVTKYDVIIGYRADDSYFSFAQDFVSNTISLRKLSEAMHLGKLGEQTVLKSKNAFDRIKYIDNEYATSEEYYNKKIDRDRDAKQQYKMSKASRDTVNDIFMIDIMRQGIKSGDSRLKI